MPSSKTNMAYMCMNMYILIYYKHICIPLSRIYIVLLYLNIYYNHICISLSNACTLYIYTYMYIFMYFNHICIPLFHRFIQDFLSCREALVVMTRISASFTSSVSSPYSIAYKRITGSIPRVSSLGRGLTGGLAVEAFA